MKLTIMTDDDKVVNVEVDGDETVGTLKIILEADAGVPATEQLLTFNSVALNDMARLSTSGIKDGDLLLLARQQATAIGTPAAEGLPQELLQHLDGLRNNPAAMHGLEQNNPDLAAAIRSRDYGTVLSQIQRARDREVQLQQEYRRLEADPFNAEAQQKIEEIIREKNVEENLKQALEHNPEVFGTVSMLYVNMEVNDHYVPAFVDSGAQTTIMTVNFAEKCNLLRLVDKRFQGYAVGVGHSKIIGRVHQAPLKVGDSFLATSITILEQKNGPQFIFGLDNLYRHQCIINLKEKKLHFGSANAELPFLPEHKIPKDFQRLPSGMLVPDEGTSDAPKGSGEDTSMDETKLTEAQPNQGDTSTPNPAQVPTSQSAPEVGSNPAMDEKISKLMALGFDRAKCINALNAVGGNEEAAASLLFSEMEF